MVARTVANPLIASGLLLAIAAQAGSCPRGPQPPNTTSGGFTYTYPWPIHYQQLDFQNQTVCQAYMDVRPDSVTCNKTYTGPERTVVMLHGKNFCSVTWEATVRVLLGQGYRTVIPDHIGFCKSDKPQAYQFSLQQLALNTLTILDHLGLTSSNSSIPSIPPTAHSPLYIMGHSLGGMLSTRFALMYPSVVSRLILVDPIGLEDWKAKGVPYLPIENIYLQEAASNYTSIRGYEQQTYYVGTWDAPVDDVWVNMLLQVYKGPLGKHYAYDQALITDMVLTQPIAYEFPLLAKIPKTLLVVGDKDNTAIGKQWSPSAVQAILGNYKVLGKQTAKAIGQNCTLIEFPDLGHAPFIQAPDRFHQALLSWLSE